MITGTAPESSQTFDDLFDTARKLAVDALALSCDASLDGAYELASEAYNAAGTKWGRVRVKALVQQLNAVAEKLGWGE